MNRYYLSTEAQNCAGGTPIEIERELIIVHEGARGKQGIQGDQGIPGEQGDSIHLVGTWQEGGVYGPLDAVNWRSSSMQGVQSLFIQRDTFTEQVSTIEPQLEPARWVEIGAIDLSRYTASAWRVTQNAHGFLYIGTAIAFNGQVMRYVHANASIEEKVGFALIREVVWHRRLVVISVAVLRLGVVHLDAYRHRRVLTAC